MRQAVLSLTITATALALLATYLMFRQSFGPAFLVAGGAMIFDACDGYLARRWRVTSRLGAAIDTITDIFLYLLLPALWWWFYGINYWILLLYVAAGVFRLVRFFKGGLLSNNNRLYYTGWPVYISYLLLVPFFYWPIATQLGGLLLIVTALLMISKVPFPKQTIWQYGLSLIAYLVIVVTTYYV